MWLWRDADKILKEGVFGGDSDGLPPPTAIFSVRLQEVVLVGIVVAPHLVADWFAEAAPEIKGLHRLQG